MTPKARLAARLVAAALATSVAACGVDTKQEVACYGALAGTTCLDRDHAEPHLSVSRGSCGEQGDLASVDDGPLVEPPTPYDADAGVVERCCYLVTRKKTTTPANLSFGCGRPLSTASGPRVALLRRGPAWAAAASA